MKALDAVFYLGDEKKIRGHFPIHQWLACFGCYQQSSTDPAKASLTSFLQLFYLQKKLAVGSMNKVVCFVSKGFFICVSLVPVLASSSSSKSVP